MLEFHEVSIAYGGGIQAVQAVSFTVPANRILAIIGGNGAGKTSLMRAAAGTLEFQGGAVTGGSITLNGQSIHELGPEKIVRQGLALVPEGRQVFSALTVEENLEAGASSVSSETLRQQRMDNAYAMFEVLGQRRRQPASLLSGGEQQMLAIARGLMSGPDVLLLDEPTLGLAPKIVVQIGEVLQTINETGTTVVLVEQNAAMALGIAHEGIVLERGEVSIHGPAADVRKSSDVQALYLGGSSDEATEQTDAHPLATLGRWTG